MNFRIPLFDLNYDENELNAVKKVLESKWISMGEITNRFETEFAKFINGKYAVAVSSGTGALHLALKSLDIKADDEVICPSLTFVATANVIKYVGAKPVFADVKSYEDLTIDPDDIFRKISPKTKAIMVMHYGGFACNMDEITKIAKKYNLKIIEDATHAPGSVYNGKNLGTIGDVGCFSFFSNKNISTAEGGMVVTNDETIARKIKLLRSHGMTTMSYQRAKGHATSYDVVDLGYNYRIDDIRSSLGLEQLKKLPSEIKKREQIKKIYIEQLSEIEDKILIPFKNYKWVTTNYIFPIVLKSGMRDKVREELASRGIQTSVHYPAVHKFTIYNKKTIHLPVTEYVEKNEITLPMFSQLTNTKIKEICNKLKESLNGN